MGLPPKNAGRRGCLGEEEVRKREKHGDQPAEGADGGHATLVAQGKYVQRPTDGQVALQGESHDGEHARVRGPCQGAKSV